ncbi:glycosyltransferase family 2 protein, partial [Nocardia cyriacigeorgica]|uniref:glycosyltransferase family 2 protein n=1 Tax=Nocardia cyriacigeorgica TaxID=135487 RepID=UPI003CC7E5E9
PTMRMARDQLAAFADAGADAVPAGFVPASEAYGRRNGDGATEVVATLQCGGGVFGLPPQPPRRYLGQPVTDAVTDVDWISGCCMVFRRSAFDQVAGFDTRYFLYFEEVQMALDMHRAGYRAVLDPSVEIRHREGGSMRSAPFRKVRAHHRSALRFYCDYHRGTPWMLAAPLVAVGLAVRGTLAAARTAVTGRLTRG